MFFHAKICQIQPPDYFRPPKAINDTWVTIRRTDKKACLPDSKDATNDQGATSSKTAPQPNTSNTGKRGGSEENVQQSNDVYDNRTPPSTPSMSAPPTHQIVTVPATDGLRHTPPPPDLGASGEANGSESDGSLFDQDYSITEVKSLM